MARYSLTNARKMEHAYPATFNAAWDTDAIDVGDAVKLENGGMRSWVTVTWVSPDHRSFEGTPDYPRDFGGEKVVRFKAWNVLDWHPGGTPSYVGLAAVAAVVGAGLYFLFK